MELGNQGTLKEKHLSTRLGYNSLNKNKED